MRKTLIGFLCLTSPALFVPEGAVASAVSPSASCTATALVLPASNPVQPGEAHSTCTQEGHVELFSGVAGVLGGVGPAAFVDASAQATYTFRHIFEGPDTRRTLKILINIDRATGDGSGTENAVLTGPSDAVAITRISAQGVTNDEFQGTNTFASDADWGLAVTLENQGHQEASGPVELILERTSADPMLPTTLDVTLRFQTDALMWFGSTGTWETSLAATIQSVSVETA